MNKAMRFILKIIPPFFLVIISLIGGWFLDSYAENNQVILIADPKILSIQVTDNQEKIIDLKNQKDIAYGPSPEIPNNTDYTKIRKTVYQKLKQAQELLPKGLHFCLYEGYRSLDLQKTLFDHRFEKVKNQNPNWPHNEIFVETTKLVSPVINQDGSANIPPHSTGGAIDVYLIDNQGKAVDMGMHPKDWIDNAALAMTFSPLISPEAQNNRRIMSQALSAVGFVNYPTEYWHWSYGDRYWAYFQPVKQAIYDTIPITNSLTTTF